MLSPNLKLALGALTGALTLVAMIRLISGGFPGAVSPLAWSFILLALLPWIVYAGWRGRRSRLTPRTGLVVLGIDVIALILVWLFTIGPVLALAGSFVAFVVIWVNDWPARKPRGEERFVRIEDFGRDDD